MAITKQQRGEFYDDIIITALEGGIGHWSTCDEYDWKAHAYAVIRPLNDEADDYGDTQYRVDRSAIIKAFKLIREEDREQLLLSRGHVNHFLNVWDDCDAGGIDADDADILVQLAIFGKVTYG